MSLLPLLVWFSCPRILIYLFSSMLLPLCPCPCPASTSFISYLSPCTISISKLSYLCTISPPLSSISIKGELLIDAKVCIWGRWLRLESCIFYGHHLIVGMTPLVDTTCKTSWDTTHRIFDLDTNWWDTSPKSFHGSSIWYTWALVGEGCILYLMIT